MPNHPPNDIAKYRRFKNPIWTQADLARHVGCTPWDIHKYETGKRGVSFAMAIKIAHSLGRHVEEVFYGEVDWMDTWLGERSRTLDTEEPAAP